MNYHSQCEQDLHVDEILRGMTGGVFVEAGAHNGICFSNSLFFERERGWTGLCIEPHPETFSELQSNRKCHTANFALGSETKSEVLFVQVSDGCSGCSALLDVINIPRLDDFITRHGGEKKLTTVQMMRTQDAFDAYGISHIDYFSLDTDGNELDVLHGIDWNKTTIRVMTIENTENDMSFVKAVSEMGFYRIKRLQWDDLYLRV